MCEIKYKYCIKIYIYQTYICITLWIFQDKRHVLYISHVKNFLTIYLQNIFLEV